jgi:outer membrane protein assembly factor BamB
MESFVCKITPGGATYSFSYEEVFSRPRSNVGYGKVFSTSYSNNFNYINPKRALETEQAKSKAKAAVNVVSENVKSDNVINKTAENISANVENPRNEGESDNIVSKNTEDIAANVESPRNEEESDNIVSKNTGNIAANLGNPRNEGESDNTNVVAKGRHNAAKRFFRDKFAWPPRNRAFRQPEGQSKPIKSGILEGDIERKSGVYSNVHKHLSNESTYQKTDYKRLRRKSNFAMGLIVGLIVTGCSTDSKITGKREVFLPDLHNIIIDHDTARKKVVLPVEQAKEWLQDGLTPRNVLINAKFDANKADLLWKTRVGKDEGATDKLISNIVSKGGVLFGGNVNGEIFALNLKDHKVLWRTSVGKSGIARIGGVGILDDRSIRPLSKASESGVLGGDMERKSGAYSNVRERLSTGSTSQKTDYEELRKWSIIATTVDGNVHKIDPQNGKIIKTKNIGGTIRSAPRIWQNKMLVQTNSNGLVMLNSDLKILWQHGEPAEDVVFLGNSSPSTDGSIVIGAYSTGEYKAYDMLSGNEVWEDFMVPSLQYETTATMLHICAAPVISGGLSFVFGHGGRLVANDMMSGNRVWDLDISGISTPAIAGDWMFVTDWESRVFCIEKSTGKVKWRTHIPEDKYGNIATNWTKPIIAGNTLVIATNGGIVAFFDINTGKTVKVIKTTAWAPSSAIVVEGVLYILSGDGSVYAFG